MDAYQIYIDVRAQDIMTDENLAGTVKLYTDYAM